MSQNLISIPSTETMRIRSLIEDTFEKNVKGLIPDLHEFNLNHDGAEGDWLTKKMGLSVNGRNEPDFMGFEMKKHSRGKTTFGDWSPDEALYKAPSKELDREKFLELFGSPNANKDGRYSWSGTVFPKVGKFNSYGQMLAVDGEKNILATYTHEKNSIAFSKVKIPQRYTKGEIVLAKWSHKTLRRKVESKFNQRGWFRCLKNSEGAYDRLQFGGPINFENFIQLFMHGTIYLDCGMHQVNPRPYMNFRASNELWNALAEK